MTDKRHRDSKHDFPDNCHIVRDYETLKAHAKQFAAGQIDLLVILGGPGKGKGQTVKRAMEAQAGTSEEQFMNKLNIVLENTLNQLAGVPPQPEPILSKGLYIKGTVSHIKFHIRLFEHVDQPICIDDSDAASSALKEQIKHIAETDQWKVVMYDKASSVLLAADVPLEFHTSSPLCIIKNAWDTSDPINQAIQSRGMFIHFDPTWAAMYKYIATWFWDQEILDYLLAQIPYLKEPDIRLVTQAYNIKKANIKGGLPWQAVIDNHFADKEQMAVLKYLAMEFPTKTARIEAWMEETGAGDSTWYRIVKTLDALRCDLPDRIILTRTEPERKPRPSPVYAPKRKGKNKTQDGSDDE